MLLGADGAEGDECAKRRDDDGDDHRPRALLGELLGAQLLVRVVDHRCEVLVVIERPDFFHEGYYAGPAQPEGSLEGSPGDALRKLRGWFAEERHYIGQRVLADGYAPMLRQCVANIACCCMLVATADVTLA